MADGHVEVGALLAHEVQEISSADLLSIAQTAQTYAFLLLRDHRVDEALGWSGIAEQAWANVSGPLSERAMDARANHYAMLLTRVAADRIDPLAANRYWGELLRWVRNRTLGVDRTPKTPRPGEMLTEDMRQALLRANAARTALRLLALVANHPEFPARVPAELARQLQAGPLGGA